MTGRVDRPPATPRGESATTLLRSTDVHTYYGKIHALQGIDIEVRAGEIVTLIGSTARARRRRSRRSAGCSIRARARSTFDGKDISQDARPRARPRGIGQAPEGRRIFSRLTVLENLQMGGFTRTRAEIAEDIERGLSTLFPRLTERDGQKGGTLSGGEQQMLAIGRALMTTPAVLLLDEPSLGLAPILVQQIFAIIREINAAGDDDPARRAERPPGARRRGPRLRPPDRRGRPGRRPATELRQQRDVRKAYLGEI